MNGDKFRVIGNVVSTATNRIVHPDVYRRIPVVSPYKLHGNSCADAYVGLCQNGSHIYVEGSLLSWYLQRNDCGPLVFPLLSKWASEVIQIAFPGHYYRMKKITACELFGMIDAGDRETAECTIEYVKIYGRLRYNRHEFSSFPATITGPGTVYSQEIEYFQLRNYLMRIYSKDAQQYGCCPYLATLPSSDRLIRLEFAIGCAFIYRYCKLHSIQCLTWEDLEKIYCMLLDRLMIFDPMHPKTLKELSDKQRAIFERWKGGADESSRDYRTINEIRDRTGFDLKKSYASQACFAHNVPHLSLEEIKDPSRDYEKGLWEEHKSIIGPFPVEI